MKKNIRINVPQMLIALYCMYLICVCAILVVGGSLLMNILTIDIMKGMFATTIAVTIVELLVFAIYKHAIK